MTDRRAGVRPGGSGPGLTSTSTAGCASPARTPRRSPASTARRCSSTTARASPRTPAGSRRRSPATGLPFRLRFALKANPLPEILEVVPRSRRARHARRASASTPARRARSIARARVRLAAGRDQLHRHERLRARPRRPARARRPPNLDAISQIERYGRRAPGRTIGIRIDPGDRRRLQRAPRVQRVATDEVRDRARAARRRARRRRAARPRRSTRSTSTPGRAGWPTASPASSAPCPRPSRRSTGCAPPAIRSPRSTSAAGSGCRPARTSDAVDLDAYAAVLARHLGPLGVTVALRARRPPRQGCRRSSSARS